VRQPTEIALVFARLDHIASVIVKADHGIKAPSGPNDI
jgi:hypothetical protein